MKKLSWLWLGIIFLFVGCGNSTDDTDVVEVTMEEIYAAQDREAIVSYHGDVWYDFCIYKDDETTEETYYFTDDYMYHKSEDTYQLYQDNKYVYAQDKNGYSASVSNVIFDLTEYDNFLFQKEKECSTVPQVITETSLNGDNLKVVTQYSNQEFAKELVEGLGFFYEEGCVLQTTYIVNNNSFVIYACEDRLLFTDDTEEVIRKYNAFYELNKNEYPEKFVELQERMNATEDVTKYTIVYVSDGASREVIVKKGDTLKLELDTQHYGLYYDAEGLQPLETMAIQSNEDSRILYVIENP